MSLQDFPIHRAATERLLKSIEEGRVPHAQYFQCKEGAGGLGLALQYAQELLAGEADMFGGVDTRASRLEHPDLHMIFPMVQSVDKTSESSIPDLRAMLKDNPYLSFGQWIRSRGEHNKKAIISKYEAESISKKLGLRSFEGGKKVLIIWKAELMNQECANKLLKLVEEPPQGSVIVMVGENADALLPTIRSRTQVVELGEVTHTEMMGILSQLTDKGQEAIQRAVMAAEGSISSAIDLLQDREDEHLSYVMEWLRLCYQRKVQETMEWGDKIAALGREEVIRTLHTAHFVFESAFRKNYMSTQASPDATVETFVSKFSPFIHNGNVDQVLSHTDTAINDIQRNGNARVILLDTSFKLMRTLRVERPETA